MEDGYSIKLSTNPEKQKKGSNTYSIPEFERIDTKQLPQAIIDKGIQAYKDLAEYHASKLHNDKERIELGGGDIDLNQTFTDDTYTPEVGGVPADTPYGSAKLDKAKMGGAPAVAPDVDSTDDDLPF